MVTCRDLSLLALSGEMKLAANATQFTWSVWPSTAIYQHRYQHQYQHQYRHESQHQYQHQYQRQHISSFLSCVRAIHRVLYCPIVMREDGWVMVETLDIRRSLVEAGEMEHNRTRRQVDFCSHSQKGSDRSFVYFCVRDARFHILQNVLLHAGQ